MRSTLLLAFIVAAAQTVLGQESTTVANGATECQFPEEIVCKTDTGEICMRRAKNMNGIFCADDSASHGCLVTCGPGTVLAPPAPDALGCLGPSTCIGGVLPPGDWMEGLDCEYECSTFWGDTCMPQEWVCDGIIDCEDGSDEDEATCGEDTVPEPWDYWADCTDEDYACSTVFGEECIPPHWVCDHIIDCEDESDEDESTCGEGWEDEEFDAWMNATYLGPALYQDAPEYATVPVPIDVETRADARRKATLLKVREARVKARAETVAKSPVE